MVRRSTWNKWGGGFYDLNCSPPSGAVKTFHEWIIPTVTVHMMSADRQRMDRVWSTEVKSGMITWIWPVLFNLSYHTKLNTHCVHIIIIRIKYEIHNHNEEANQELQLTPMMSDSLKVLVFDWCLCGLTWLWSVAESDPWAFADMLQPIKPRRHLDLAPKLSAMPDELPPISLIQQPCQTIIIICHTPNALKKAFVVFDGLSFM